MVSYPGTSPLLIGQTLTVTDPLGKLLGPVRTFDLNPSGNTGQHNFAGYPDHLSSTSDALFDSGDPSYRYSTSISNGRTATISTYDSGHRLVGRKISVTSGGDVVTVQQQALTYPPPTPAPQVANYSRPITSTITFSASSGPSGVRQLGTSRSVKTTTHYDDAGRISDATDEAGTTTSTSYDTRYGLVLSTDTVGADGSHRVVTNTLTRRRQHRDHERTGGQTRRGLVGSHRDELSVQPERGGQPAHCRLGTGSGAGRRRRTGVDDDELCHHRERRGRHQVGRRHRGRRDHVGDHHDHGARPGHGAPGQRHRRRGPHDHRQLRRRRPADRDHAAHRSDLVHPLHPGRLRLAGQQTGDRAGRAPTRTTYDVLGRVVKITDNVQNGAFVADPTTRTVSTQTYSADGSTLTSTDLAGRTSVVVSDPLGQQVSRQRRAGITITTTHDDVANTTTRRTIGSGTTAASQVVLAHYDNLGRTTSSRTTYPYSSGGRALFLADPVDETSYDGIGRTTTVTTGDLTTTPDYAGAGGVPVDTVVAPAATAKVQSQPITVSDATAIDASPSVRTLQQPGQPDRPGTKTTLDAAGRIISTTDPLGRLTTYGYTPDGQLATRTTPMGTVTTDNYDPKTGQLLSVVSKPRGDNPITTSYGYVPAGRPVRAGCRR